MCVRLLYRGLRTYADCRFSLLNARSNGVCGCRWGRGADDVPESHVGDPHKPEGLLQEARGPLNTEPPAVATTTKASFPLSSPW